MSQQGEEVNQRISDRRDDESTGIHVVMTSKNGGITKTNGFGYQSCWKDEGQVESDVDTQISQLLIQFLTSSPKDSDGHTAQWPWRNFPRRGFSYTLYLK